MTKQQQMVPEVVSEVDGREGGGGSSPSSRGLRAGVAKCEAPPPPPIPALDDSPSSSLSSSSGSGGSAMLESLPDASDRGPTGDDTTIGGETPEDSSASNAEGKDEDGDEWRLVVQAGEKARADGGLLRKRDKEDGNGGDDDDRSEGEWTSCSEPRPSSAPMVPPGDVVAGGGGGGGLIGGGDLLAAARKAGVAVGGGALVGLGLVMIPLPTPFGCAVAASGMAVLGTEFPAAQRALDGAREGLTEGLERMASLDDEEDNRGGDKVVEGDTVLVGKPPNDEEDDFYKGELEEMTEEAKRVLIRKASQFSRRVLPLVRQEAAQEGNEAKDDTKNKENVDGSGATIAQEQQS